MKIQRLSGGLSNLLMELHCQRKNMANNGECFENTNFNTIFPGESPEQCCFYCNERDVNKLTACEFCNCVFYCLRDHQKIHFNDR